MATENGSAPAAPPSIHPCPVPMRIQVGQGPSLPDGSPGVDQALAATVGKALVQLSTGIVLP